MIMRNYSYSCRFMNFFGYYQISHVLTFKKRFLSVKDYDNTNMFYMTENIGCPVQEVYLRINESMQCLNQEL